VVISPLPEWTEIQDYERGSDSIFAFESVKGYYKRDFVSLFDYDHSVFSEGFLADLDFQQVGRRNL
jgi:hypothetical protein